MKNLLFLSLLFSTNVFSQNNYTFEKDATIYDIPGGEFLTAVAIDDTIFIKHFDVSGNLIWQDSLSFTPSISPVYFNEIVRFKNTDEYVISTYADPTPSTMFWQTFQNDTLIYQFSKLKLSTHTFITQVVDTFIGKSIDLLELNDTSIYVLVPDVSISSIPFNIKTYSIDTSMDVSMIAPLDSVQTYPGGGSRFVYGDSIYFHLTNEGSHYMKKYSTQMSNIQTNNQNLLTGMDYNSSYYQKPMNKDSMLIFTEGTSSGNWAVKWRLDWVDLSMTPIHSSVFNSPATVQAPANYQSWFFNSAIDRTNRKIVILTKDIGPMPTTIQPKVFIYDFSFNLICEFPSIIGDQDENELVELNGLVYLRNNNSLNSTLTQIDCSSLNLNEFASDNEFELFPNPTQSIISISNHDKKSLSIVVLSSDGKELIKLFKQESLISLDLHNLPKGMYLIKISDDNDTEIKRLIKE